MSYQKGSALARNSLPDRVSADIGMQGWKYMGFVTAYSHLHACGIINDHLGGAFTLKNCFPARM